MIAMIEAAVARKLALFAAALALALSVTGCAAGSAPGPITSHGVDYCTFDPPIRATAERDPCPHSHRMRGAVAHAFSGSAMRADSTTLRAR